MNLLKGCLQVINTNSKGESKTLDLAEIHSVGVGGWIMGGLGSFQPVMAGGNCPSFRKKLFSNRYTTRFRYMDM